MENTNIIIQWFWLVKLAGVLLFTFLVYKSLVVHKIKHKVYNIAMVVVLILLVVSPVKMQIDTKSYHERQSKVVESTKDLPPKVSDDSFKERNESLKGISKEDLK